VAILAGISLSSLPLLGRREARARRSRLPAEARHGQDRAGRRPGHQDARSRTGNEWAAGMYASWRI
jgi:hypothetical protein